MRKPLVAGNWKMNGSRAEIRTLLQGIRSELDAGERVSDIAIFPPAVYLAEVIGLLSGSGIVVGAQDADERTDGAVTGGISAGMLKDIGADLVLVGHSERRSLFGETNQVVAEKFGRCLEQQLVPIACVGETLEQREADETIAVVTAQVEAILGRYDASVFETAMIAYEPVWAIGTGRSATPEQANEVHEAIRTHVAGHSNEIAAVLRILYGGSVNADNAADLFTMQDIDGALVGGASLKSDSFAAICRAAEKSPG